MTQMNFFTKLADIENRLVIARGSRAGGVGKGWAGSLELVDA